MKQNEQKLFEGSGINPKDGSAVLSVILAAPNAIVDEIGIDGAIRCAVEASMNMTRDQVKHVLNFKSLTDVPNHKMYFKTDEVSKLNIVQKLKALPKLPNRSRH